MKKNVFVLVLISMFSLVSAGPVQGVQQLLEGIGQIIIIIINFASNTVLNINAIDQFLFVKILLFLIILLIVYTVTKRNSMFGGKKNKAISWIISVSVAILATKYLPNEIVQAILLQYGSLAVGITVFLPLAIYFFFIHQSGIGPFGRRAGWLVFATSFFALWSFRYDNLGSANIIYWIGLAFIVISVMFDKSIHREFGFVEIREGMRSAKAKRRADAINDLEELEKYFDKGYYTEKEYENRKAHLTDIIKKNV